MAIDRAGTLKKAEKLLQQGKLEAAIEEYVQLVEDQPSDWNAINALGDLYVKAGDTTRAVEQFIRVADHLHNEGILPKAAALYKKALKVSGDHEHTLLRLSEITARQGLLVEAKSYLRQLAEQRRVRGDDRGAAECLVRLGTLDATDAEATMTAARAAVQLGDTSAAVGFLKEAAEVFAKMRRDTEALDVLVEAATVDPNDVDLRARISQGFVRRGEIERARPFLTRETTADDPDLLLALARIEMDSGSEIEARTTLMRLLTLAPARHEEVTRLAETVLESGRVDSAFGCIEVVTDAALLEGNWLVAVRSLQTFVRRQKRHVPALSRLVEVCAEAGMDEELREAQADLVDAYLESGLGAEARVIAEDLVARDPQAADNIDRLRRVLELLRVPDVEHAIGDLTATREPEDTEREEVAVVVAAGESVALEVSPAEEPAFVLDSQEVDLTDALAGIGAMHVPPAPQPSSTPQDLETVFDHIRTRVDHDQEAAAAAEEYERGVQLLFGGDALEAAVSHLQNAARMPLWRFKAAAELGRLYIAREDLQRAVEWLERAAEAPAPTEEEGFSVLYDLAVALEGLGESARALAIFMELHANAEGYRDVRERLDRLARVQTGSAQQ